MENIYRAKVNLTGVADHTPLMLNHSLSEEYDCRIYLKREDLQPVRSYKIRGAYNKMKSVLPEAQAHGVVCASAGNHAQGVALACRSLGVRGKIYMPAATPAQKIRKVKLFGKDQVEVILFGDTFDDAYAMAMEDIATNGGVFLHPFNDAKVIEGQGTVGLEILEDSNFPIDYLIAPIGGGGLMAGVSTVFSNASPHTTLIGVEPEGAPAMYEALRAGEVQTLTNIDPFVDGAAVRRVGELTFEIIRDRIREVILIPEGKVCTTILQLYNGEGIVTEPAGALSISALDYLREEIRGKNVVCILSGSNNDITRTEEIRERSLLYEGLKHYFIIRFPQRAGALRDFLNNVLGETDDITYFEYTKKYARSTGPALVGIQVEQRSDYDTLIERMNAHNILYQTLNDSQMLFDLLV